MTMEQEDMQQFLDDFRQTIIASSAQLRSINQTAAGPTDQWCPKEILGHLIDSAANNHQRFVRAQFTDDLVFPGYQQDDWVTVQRYEQESWSDLVQLWTFYNLHLLHVISAIPKDKMQRLRAEHNLDEIAWKTVPRSEPATLEYFVRDYVGHLKHHLDQIFGKDHTL